MSAILQFKDYNVIESHYKCKPSINDEGSYEVTPRIFYKLNINPHNIGEAVLFLGIELGDIALKKSDFYAKAIVSGFFVVSQRPQELKEEEIISYYKVNATAILFPYLRSVISDITSKGSETPIIIPTMNISEMIRDEEFEEIPREESNEFD